MADVTMPQLGETVTEGTITKWFKKVGDPVALDEPLFEVSTDKVDTEVPSPTAGFLSEIKVNEGDTVDVGELIAVISDTAGAAPAAQAAAPALSTRRSRARASRFCPAAGAGLPTSPSRGPCRPRPCRCGAAGPSGCTCSDR